MLAVSTSDNGIKILANADGLRLLRSMENRQFDASRVASASVVKVDGLDAFPFLVFRCRKYYCEILSCK